MSLPGKTGITITLSGAMVAAALVWGGSIQAKVEQSQGVYRVLDEMNTRLSHIEGAMGIRPDKKSGEKGE